MRIGALAWTVAAGLAAATLAAAAADRAWADGAIAVGTTGEGTNADVVRDGIAFGMAVNVSKDMAAEIAVKRCRTFEARRAAERCKVVATFSGECFAIAYDPEPGTPGAGWGVGPDQLVANQKAVAMCEQAAGPARKGHCQVERFGCDTTPKPAPDPQPDANPDAKPAPDTDPRSAPDNKGATDAQLKAAPAKKAVHELVEEPKEAREAKQAPEPGKAVSVAPPPPAPKPVTEPLATADPPQPTMRSPAAPLLPILAMAGVGAAYAVGQLLRGRLTSGMAERHVLTGGGLAVAAAIAIKLVDMAGASETVAAVLAGLVALVAALLA